MKQLKIMIYPLAIFFIALLYLLLFSKLTFIKTVNAIFLINMPVFIVSIVLFTVQRGLYSPLRYSFKRFAIFFFKGKRNKLMQELDAKTTTEMEEKMKAKYLYTSPRFEYLKYTLLQSILIFIITLIIAMIY